MAYFSALGGTGGTSATITVTYSEDFYGQTITATNGTTTLTKTATSSGTLTFDVSEGGTWVVSGTVEGATYSESVDVTFEYTAPPLVALPDGSTALPVNDIQMWLKCAGIRDKTTYTTLADVLADTETFIALCADSNACDYMARSTNWASGVAADSTAMLIVGKYNYCANALLDDNTWETAIRNSPYSDYVNPDPSAGYIPLVPRMTSNTTPSGEASCYPIYGSYPAWQAFDNNDNTYCHLGNKNTNGGEWVQYESENAFIAQKAKIYFKNNSANRAFTYKIQGSNTGNSNDWTDLVTREVTTASDGTLLEYVDLDNNTAYKYHRAYMVTSAYYTSQYGYMTGVGELQFYRESTLPIIHSAVEDSIFYMDDGSPVALCGIPIGDTIDVDLEAYKGQTLTLVSTVAKDPTNLSNDFSMNVRITPNITEIYLMPLKTLYWWGNASSDIEDCTTANGWNAGSWSMSNPTRNTCDITLAATSSTYCGIGSKNTISVSKLKCIVKGNVASSESNYGVMKMAQNKNQQSFNDSKYFDSTSMKYYEQTISTSYYANITTYGGGNTTVYALWYE